MNPGNPSDAVPYRKAGEPVLIRFRRSGPVSYAIPARIIVDCPDYSALFVTPGTPTKTRVFADGSPIPREYPYEDLVRLPRHIGDGRWKRNHALFVFPAGTGHDIRLYWSDEDWSFRGYYVNLQDVVRRVANGYDTADHVLDLDVAPDLTWRWKDEDEFVIAQQIGRFTPLQAGGIRGEGERVIADIEARRWPFDGSLTDWRPDSRWTIPTVHADWNEDL